MPASTHRVVVVGGGAGGLELVTRLGRTLGRTGRAHVTLVDASTTHLWKPLLHEVAAGTLDSNADELNYLVHARKHHFHFHLGAVDGLDRERRQIHVARTTDDEGAEVIPAHVLGYDTLVLAVGSIANDFGTPGVAEHCFFLDTRAQADRFHQRLLWRFFGAATNADSGTQASDDIVIVGAGATGVELAAELHTALRIMAQHIGPGPEQPAPRGRIRLVEAADRVLPALPERISASVMPLLDRIGVEVLLGERITRADTGGFHTASGRYLPSRLKVWVAGIRAPDFLADFDGLETARGNQLAVRVTLQTTHDDDIFALGDCAWVKDAATPIPPRAQTAHQQAQLLTRSIRQRLRGGPLPEYVYKDYGSLVSLSHSGTVGSLMGNLMRRSTGSVMVEGWLARMTYLSLYKMHQRALHGTPWVLLSTLANLITRRSRPSLKLH